jgi:hypothetical protein
MERKQEDKIYRRYPIACGRRNTEKSSSKRAYL